MYFKIITKILCIWIKEVLIFISTCIGIPKYFKLLLKFCFSVGLQIWRTDRQAYFYCSFTFRKWKKGFNFTWYQCKELWSLYLPGRGPETCHAPYQLVAYAQTWGNILHSPKVFKTSNGAPSIEGMYLKL